jgi:hypothetical protein
LITGGAKAGNRILRACWWNGGSEVMGGAPPMGAGGASGLSLGFTVATTTPRLEK